jgi:DivIVA domain-containing protein
MSYTAGEIGDLQFRYAGRLRRGYDADQVDAFMMRIESTLRGLSHPPVTARDLVTARFRRVWIGERGYLCAQVDAFLQEVAPSVIRASSALRDVTRSAQRESAQRGSTLRTSGQREPSYPQPVPAQREGRHWLGKMVHRPSR